MVPLPVDTLPDCLTAGDNHSPEAVDALMDRYNPISYSINV